MINTLRNINPHLNIRTTFETSPLFSKLNISTKEIVDYASQSIKAFEENYYASSDPLLEEISAVMNIRNAVFENTPIQAGWCAGGGRKMNGMEWHKSSEVIIACTDMLLFLGSFSAVINNSFESSKSIALFLKSGEAVELYPMTLHFAPLRVNTLFKAAIILPKGTNSTRAEGISGAHRAVNKWLIVHPENLKALSIGGKIGISGENLSVNPMISENYEYSIQS